MAPDGYALGKVELEDLAELTAPRLPEAPVPPDEVMQMEHGRRTCSVCPRSVRLFKVHDVGSSREAGDVRAKVGFGELAAGSA